MVVPPNPGGLCMCGCGKPTSLARQTHKKLGYVKGHPVKFLPGHHMKTSPHEYVVDPATGCWEWQQNIDRHGYGRKSVGYGSQLAHRWVYEQTNGPIPTDLDLDHLCRNTRCVNPNHLEPVSHAENIRRGKNAKINGHQVHQIRALKGVLSYAKIGKQFGIDSSTVSRIMNGQTWRDV